MRCSMCLPIHAQLTIWKRASGGICGRNMRAVDANVVVRLIVRDESVQVARAEAFVAPGAWVSHLVLAETVWVLGSVYGLSRDRIAIALGMLIEHHNLVLQEENAVAAALAEFKRQKTVGFVDCLIVEVARSMGHLPFGTFDKSLSRLDDAVEP